ncbi:MAG: hypothetical protein EZS28_056176 [Streblomastix strix]|uniref:Uncharacterized protein n=1 Tax=Streblomastix strix TaxID=222440 RepID=A0A5J4PQF2_9EUKA|nr:MAG: hypothetical protein EZS28_056176 [Streblomastix strix]
MTCWRSEHYTVEIRRQYIGDMIIKQWRSCHDMERVQATILWKSDGSGDNMVEIWRQHAADLVIIWWRQCDSIEEIIWWRSVNNMVEFSR